MTRERYQERSAEWLVCLDRLQAEGLCRVLPIAPALFGNGDTFYSYSGGELFMRDTNHLTPAGAMKVMQELLPLLKKMLPRD